MLLLLLLLLLLLVVVIAVAVAVSVAVQDSLGCFLGLREPPNPVNYDTKRLRLAKYLVNYSIRAPLVGVLGPLWGSLAGVEGLVTAFLRGLS